MADVSMVPKPPSPTHHTVTTPIKDSAAHSSSVARSLDSPLPTPPRATADTPLTSPQPEGQPSPQIHLPRLSPRVGVTMGLPLPQGPNGLGAQLGMSSPPSSRHAHAERLIRPGYAHSRAASYNAVSPSPPSVPSTRQRYDHLASSTSAGAVRKSPEPLWSTTTLTEDPETQANEEAFQGRHASASLRSGRARLSAEKVQAVTSEAEGRHAARTSGELTTSEALASRSSGGTQGPEGGRRAVSHHTYGLRENGESTNPSTQFISVSHRRVVSANPRSDVLSERPHRAVSEMKPSGSHPQSLLTPAPQPGMRLLRSSHTHEPRSIAINRTMAARGGRASTARGKARRMIIADGQGQEEDDEEEELPRPDQASGRTDGSASPELASGPIEDDPAKKEQQNNRTLGEEEENGRRNYDLRQDDDLMLPEVGRGVATSRAVSGTAQRRDTKLAGSGGSSEHSSTPESVAIIDTARSRTTHSRYRSIETPGSRRDSPVLASMDSQAVNEQYPTQTPGQASRPTRAQEASRNALDAQDIASSRAQHPFPLTRTAKENMDPNASSRKTSAPQKSLALQGILSAKVPAPLTDARQYRQNVGVTAPGIACEEDEDGEQREGDANAKYSLLMEEEARRQASGQGCVKESSIGNRYSSVKTTTFNGSKFRKVGKAGEGGFSNVYIVRGPIQRLVEVDMDDGEGGVVTERRLIDTADEEQALFAMKQVNLKKLDPSSQKEVIQEASLLEELALCEGNERFILRYFGHRVNNNSLKMLLELGGEDISKLLRRGGPLSQTDICNYWRQMVEAVEFIHDKGNIVHTDLKPANFLKVNGRIKLIDFGIAQMIPAHTVHISRDAMVGTPNYMAPEAVKTRDTGQRNKVYKAGKCSDVWSLGCILYQMVYGRPPFDGIKPEKRTAAIMDERHVIPFPPTRQGPSENDEDVDEDILQVMRATLQYNVERRITIPELLQHPFLTAYLRETVPVSRATVRDLLKRVTAAKDQFHEDNYLELADRFFDNLRRQDAEQQV